MVMSFLINSIHSSIIILYYMFTFLELPRPRKRLIQLMYDASQKSSIQNKLFNILFLRTPISIIGTNKIEGIELAVNYLEGTYNLLCAF